MSILLTKAGSYGIITPIPPPPYIVPYRGVSVVTTISGLTYLEGEGPSNESFTFQILASGLTPASGNVTVTPSANLEVWNGSAWTASSFNIPYTSGALTTSSIYKVRLKSGLSPGTKTDTLSLSGADAPTFDIDVYGQVIMYPVLLDEYPGADFAWSLARKLRTAYAGNCFRVRRSSDNSEQDIGFVSGMMDQASLLSFVGASDGYIVTLYDQSGNGYDATQATALNQAQIVSAGSLIQVNSKPAILFTSGQKYTFTTFIRDGASLYNFIVIKRTASGTNAVTVIETPGSGNNYLSFVFGGDNKYYFSGNSKYIQSNSTDTTTDQNLITSHMEGSALTQYKNGVEIPSTQFTVSTNPNLNELSGQGYFQENVFYNQFDDADKAGAEANIIGYYGF